MLPRTVRRLIAVLALVVTAAGCSSMVPDPTIDVSDWQILDGNKDWRYILAVPDNEKKARGLILLLHGYSGDALAIAREWESMPGMDEFYLLAPQAPRKIISEPVSTWRAGTDDEFLLKLLDKVVQEKSIRSIRVGVAGYSSGASMALYMGLTFPDRISATVAVGAGRNQVGEIENASGRYFLLAGGLDRGFNEDKAKRLAEHITGAGAFAEYHVLPGVDHAGLYNQMQPATDWFLEMMPKLDKTERELRERMLAPPASE
ncbi:dienelactone hydrolase family protein [bacterium]|nr:dienelactone hydrolase family protein [bacterium]MCB9476414.1 dienelactone hydrolase family protein [Deltaproteobacteria bacterium]MCB9478389.1 dienelactone hydrolase family protein [Deltaproteobacteria bacterium]